MRSLRPQRHARAFVGFWLAACALATGLPAAAHAQTAAAAPDAPARASVLFTALGDDGKFVEGIRAEDVRLSVDGAPREVLEVKRQAGARLIMVMAIDTSASQEFMLPKTKLAADVFLKGMAPVTDKAAVVTFAGETTLEQEMTGDVEQVRAAVARVKFVPPPGYLGGGVVVGTPPNRNHAGLTGIWDAVWVVSNEMLSRSPGAGRRVLLLITDGVDTGSRVKLDTAVEAALRAGAVVYAVGMGDDKNFDGVEKGPLRKLAERTGGRAYFPGEVGELPDIFTRISRELTTQYVLTFAAPPSRRDRSFHKLKLELANTALRRAGVQLSHPAGFYAGDGPTSAAK